MKTIIVVYGINTDDYKWAETSFYPIKRMKETAQKNKIHLLVLFPKDFIKTNIDYYEKLKDFFIILRGEIPESVYDFLEQNSLFKNKYTPDRTSKQTADDKYFMYKFLEKERYPIAETCFAKEDALRHLSFPLIGKPRTGRQGKGIKLLDSRYELEQYAQETKNAIFQQYIDYEIGTDIRILICNKKIITIVERKSEKSITSNFHSGGTIKKTMIPLSCQNMALEIADKLSLFFCSVDFIRKSENEYVICEINSSPGFEGIEKGLSLDVADLLLKEAEFYLQNSVTR